MTLKGRMVSCGAALAALAQTGWGQPASPWRAYKIADGLPEPACSSVTVSAQGTVLARHLIAPSITMLDGYTVSTIVAPPNRGGRVYESPAGQLWAPATNGLHEFRNGQWAFRSVPEIAAESRAFAANLPHGVPLYPVRQGRVLFLLHDRLMAANAEDSDHVRTEVLRPANQTRLGAFRGMTPARDGGLWLSGARGLAKLPSPVRSLKPDTQWQEFELPEAERLKNLREPREDEAGGVTALAESADGGDAIAVRFDGQHWTTRAVGAKHIRFAWTGSEQSWWAASPNELLSRANDQSEFVPEEGISARKFFDVATEPGGAFWLATSDGLFRYAPPGWRTPDVVQTRSVSVHCFAEDGEGRLWFVSGGELHSFREQEHRTFSIPESARRSLQAARVLVPLTNGTLLFEAEDQLFRFRPASGDFGVVLPEGSDDQIKFLGLLGDGVACVQRFNPSAAEREPRLETYDGDHFKSFPVAPAIPAIGRALQALYQARNGDLWLSGEQGVACLRGGQWKTFLAAAKAAPAAAIFFAETADGRVCCATTDEFWTFDGRNWTLVRTGFDHVNGLVRSRDDNLWVASNIGLHRLTPDGWIENGVEEGLPSVTVRGVCEDRRGRLWAGTSQGLSLYHPEADRDPPKTEIFMPSEQRILEGGSLTVAFSALDKWKFTPRGRLLYSHRLDDRDWSPFREVTMTTLTELLAGNHNFQVRAMDRNGNIEAKPAQLAFAVALPWFKETRLVLIGALGLAMALFFAALAFNRHLRLRRSYAEVERKVAERTRELEIASRELLHSQKMNALGALAAGIAHDFNNILSIVKGSAQIIEDNLENPPKIRTRLDRIKTVVEQGTGIVQAMLGFSRSSDGSMEPCNLNTVVENTITLLGDAFLREVAVKVESAPDLPDVPIAKDFVQQILLNFIFNAAESMNDPKRVVLSTARLEKPPAGLVLKPAEAAGYVSVSVRDFGCGIPPENLPRIFEPFFTTKALSARRGTGLGLSMVYELARRMNAGLAVESVVGQGSTFTLILPLTQPPAGSTVAAEIANFTTPPP
jgi:signal transduction histidine kinase/ligand-binding sensor domain-containing protein